MESAQEFMESYLREKAALQEAHRQLNEPFQRKYYAKEYREFLAEAHEQRRKNPETFVMAEVSGDTAKVTTTHFLAKWERRERYHLRVAGPRWEIHSVETECFICQGTGRRGADSCPACGGAGWKDFSRGTTA